MGKLANLARMTVASAPGTGSTIALGTAAPGFITFGTAGIVNGDVLTYAIEDGTNREIGTATYSSTGPQLTGRTVINSTNGNASINASVSAQVMITAAASDFVSPGHTHSKSQITDFAHTHTKSDITDFAHTHPIADLPVATSGTSSSTQLVRADDSRLSNARTPTAHTHTKTDITDFAHTHPQSEITNLTTDLAAKAPLVNPSFTDKITVTGTSASLDLSETDGVPTRWALTANNGSFYLFRDYQNNGSNDTPTPFFLNPTGNLAKVWGNDIITSASVGVANGVASLGSDGKVPSSQLPTMSGGASTALDVTYDNTATSIAATNVQAAIDETIAALSDVSTDVIDLAASSAPKANPTFTGKVTTAATEAAAAGFNLPHGTAPTSPENGDVWTTTTGMFVRLGSNTRTIVHNGYLASVVQAGIVQLDNTTSSTSTSTAPTSNALKTTYDLANGKAPTASPTFTGKVTTAASATGGAGLNLPHGAAPSAPVNGDLWTTTTSLNVRINGNTRTVMFDQGGTFTGKITTATPTTSIASINMPHGTAPTTPGNGDMWTTTAGLSMRINGTTNTIGTNAYRAVTISTSAPSGGADGDFWAVIT